MPAFDTLQATKLLKESGFEEAQAEAVVVTVRDAIAENTATKADIGELRNSTKADIGEASAALRAEMAALRTELKTDIAKSSAALRAEITETSAALHAEIAKLRTEMYRGALVVSSGVVAAIAALIKLLQ